MDLKAIYLPGHGALLYSSLSDEEFVHNLTINPGTTARRTTTNTTQKSCWIWNSNHNFPAHNYKWSLTHSHTLARNPLMSRTAMFSIRFSYVLLHAGAPIERLNSSKRLIVALTNKNYNDCLSSYKIHLYMSAFNDWMFVQTYGWQTVMLICCRRVRTSLMVSNIKFYYNVVIPRCVRFCFVPACKSVEESSGILFLMGKWKCYISRSRQNKHALI